MHQFLSAVLSLVLSPFNWILVLLLAAWLFRKKKVRHFLLAAALIVFVLFGNPYLLNVFAKKYQPARVVVASLPVYTAGIVPGGFASVDESADGYFNASSDRFIQAVKLYHNKKIKHLLISGGNGKKDNPDFGEAAFVKKELIQFGIPDSVIFIEDASNNTYENAIHSKRILDSLKLSPPYLLITSAFHLPRAVITFKNAGVPVVGFPCNYTEGLDPFSWDDLLPRPSVLLTWDKFLKEWAGYVYYG